MEVHHHAHTSRKQFKHYMFEFFMLFLAVFAGFLAENFREHQVEHMREKEFMKNMNSDLQQDREGLRTSIEWSRRKVLHLDSLLNLLENKLYKGNEKAFYTHARYYYLRFHFRYNDGTIQQLKNAGGMRLIRNRKVVDSINYYDGLVKFRKVNESYEDDYIQQMYTFINKILNARAVRQISIHMDSVVNVVNIDSINSKNLFIYDFENVDFPTLNISEEERKLLVSHILTLIIFNENYIRYRIELYQLAGKLRNLIKKEYHLK